MEVITLILLALIFCETTFLLLKTGHQPKSSSGRKIYIDTSALIDGRILKIAQTGFFSDNLIIPRSVIRELQTLADGKDHEKRKLAREGMQNARDLERVEFCDVEILQDNLDHTPVDERLLSLAKENKGIILTTDYNLCQVAATEHIETLNPNSLTSILGNDLPDGTIFDLKITGTGAKNGQGVGHLDNGIMVVVSRADKLVGQTVRVVARRTNVSDAGKIIFADLERQAKSQERQAKSSERQNKPQDTPKGRQNVRNLRKTKPQKSTK